MAGIDSRYNTAAFSSTHRLDTKRISYSDNSESLIDSRLKRAYDHSIKKIGFSNRRSLNNFILDTFEKKVD